MFRGIARLGHPLSIAVAAALGLALPAAVLADGSHRSESDGVKSVEFIGMDAPSTTEERASAYTEAKAKITYRNGKKRTYPLRFTELHDTLSTFDGVTVGDLYDQYGNVLVDPNGNPERSEAPDGQSLIDVPGARSDDWRKRRLFLVTQQEYDWLDTAGNDNYGKQPMTMNLAAIDQDRKTGELSTVWVRNIDMSGIRGLWIPCAASLTPWNTHLGSQEYEPDARCDLDPGDPAHSCASGAIMLGSMNRYLDPTGITKPARVYDYGIVPEVSVDRHGNASVVAHRALGRVSRELAQVMPDKRTVYQGDDGTYNVMTMFVADAPADLSAGTLYAAKWIQASPDGEDGGSADLEWIRLGHSSNGAIESMVDAGIKFSDIFETGDTASCPATGGWKLIKAGHNSALLECLKLKDGVAEAAAFLETRRYAAYLGATAEFEKFEGVTVNAADRKVYVAMTRMRNGMESGSTPVDDIRIARNDAGAVYEIDLGGWQSDTDGNMIRSRYVGKAMRALVLGETINPNGKGDMTDGVGNTANVDKIASPDNLKYSEAMRTLFIGEDSGLHVNNFLWAYSIDTRKLSRILSLPAGAESTGLQAVDDANGFAYVMSNYQHAGDFTGTTPQALKDALEPLIDRYKAGIGYLGGLPSLGGDRDHDDGWRDDDDDHRRGGRDGSGGHDSDGRH